MPRDVSRHSAKDRPSEFFVDAATPTLGGEPTRLARAITMGESNAQIDFLETTPEIQLTLLARKLLFYVFKTLAFLTTFTIIAYIGVPVETIYEPIGTSKKAEDRVEIINTYSGYVVAFVETLLGMYMDKFMPVLDVYVHNTLYFLQKATATKDPTTGKFTPSVRFSRRTHQFILFFFPIALALTMGNSLRGLQAGQDADGFKHIMTVEDLKKEQPTLDLIKVKRKGNASALTGAPLGTNVADTILRNAVRERSTPFMFDTKSPCGEDNSTATEAKPEKALRTIALNVHDLDSTSAVYGFVPQEWNGEALTNAFAPKSTFKITYEDFMTAQKANKTLPMPTDFSITTAFEILIQGKLLIERAYGDAATDTYDCSLSDGLPDHEETNATTSAPTTTKPPAATTKPPTKPPTTTKPPTAAKAMGVAPVNLPISVLNHLSTRRRLADGNSSSAASDADVADDEFLEPTPDDSVNQWTYENGIRQCQGAVSSLFDMFSFDNREFHTTDHLIDGTAYIINKTLGNLSIDETEIMLEKYDLTEQIHVEVMRIDIPISPNVEYGLEQGCANGTTTGCSDYTYDNLGESFCGSDGCAFLDHSDTMKMQREIGIVPYVVNCTLDAEHVHYSSDFRGYYPTDCKKVPNAALLFGIGSYITGEEYGSNDTKHNTHAPYIIAPRRHLRFTFAKVTWQTENLAKKFNAKCGNGKETADCNGLWYQLKTSGRFLFAGPDALPTKKLAAADFRAPIPLVQLNSPTLYIPSLDAKVTLEPLNPGLFKSVKWPKKPYTVKAANGTNVTTQVALQGSQCSMLIDSYLRQVSDNNYAIEQPLQVMYTSFFYYLMQNAAVTELNDTKLALNGTLDMNKSTIALSKGDVLGNVKLKGDMQVRNIKVSIPPSSFKTSLGGCILILLLTLLVICVPARRAEFFDEEATMAQQFVAMRSDEAYPDSVHKKTLTFPATNEIVAFDELEIERMVLVHEKERDKKVYM